MSTEQTFTSQVEAVMQRNRTGEQNPLDVQMIQEVQRAVAQGNLLGEGVVAQALAISTAWQTAVESFRNTYRYGSPEHEVLDRLEQAISTVKRENILESAGIPGSLEAHFAVDYREQFRELKWGVRGLARRRLLAQLTDPRMRETDKMPLHSEDALTRYVDVKVEEIIPSLGMADLSKWVRGIGESEKWQEARANHQALTDATVIRFLEGLPLRFSRRGSRNHAGSTIEYQAPVHEAMKDEQTKARYKEALQIMLNGLYTDTDWTKEQGEEEVRKHGIQGNSFERLRQAHETFESHLFDGIHFDGQLRPGVDLRASLEHNEITDKDGARTASFARGVALRILVEGGDNLSYTVAVNTLPEKDKERIAEVARRLMNLASDTNERARLRCLLREAHTVAIDDESERADPDRAAKEKTNREAEAQLARQALREQLERRMLTLSAERLNTIDLSANLQNAFESQTGNVPEVMRKIGSNMVWAHVVEGLFMRELDADLAGFVEGTQTLSGYTRHATQLHSLLDRLSEVSHEHATLSMSSRTQREPLDTEIDPEVQQRILVLARLSGLILSDTYINDRINQASLLARSLHNAQKLGVSQEDVLDTYNRTIAAVAKHNQRIAALSPDSQIQMQDGLAYALQHKNKWKVTEGYREITISLPETASYNWIRAPGIASSSMYMDRGERTDGRVDFVYMRGQDDARQTGQVLERDAELWAQERIVPLHETVGRIRAVRGYTETRSMLVNPTTQRQLETVVYDPPRESTTIPETVQTATEQVGSGVRQLKTLSEIEGTKQEHGPVATGLLSSINTFRSSHGAELANPKRIGPIIRHTQPFKDAQTALAREVESAWRAMELPGKAPEIKSQADLDMLETSLRKIEDLVNMRQALEDLDRAIPGPEERATHYLAERIKPEADTSTTTASDKIVRLSSRRKGSLTNGEQGFTVRELLADSSLTNTVAQTLIRNFLEQDHRWCQPIHERIVSLRAAAKKNAPGTTLSEEVNNKLFAIEQKLTTNAGVSFNVDRGPIATQVLMLLKENLQLLLNDASQGTVDTSAVASVGGGKLKENLDRLLERARYYS